MPTLEATTTIREWVKSDRKTGARFWWDEVPTCTAGEARAHLAFIQGQLDGLRSQVDDIDGGEMPEKPISSVLRFQINEAFGKGRA